MSASAAALREGAMVRVGNAIYRVYGRAAAVTAVPVTVRYVRDDAAWHKAPKFGTMRQDPAALRLYGVAVSYVPALGISIGWADRGQLDHVWDPLAVASDGSVTADRVLDLMRAFTAVGEHVGIGGSRLVGLARAGSDVDLVVYGVSGRQRAAALTAAVVDALDGEPTAVERSSTLARVQRLGRALADDRTRNYLSFSVDGGVKCDVHFVQPAGTERLWLRRSLDAAPAPTRRRLRVLDAEGACFLPGYLECVPVDGAPGAGAYRFVDRACRHVVAGDELVADVVAPGERISGWAGSIVAVHVLEGAR